MAYTPSLVWADDEPPPFARDDLAAERLSLDTYCGGDMFRDVSLFADSAPDRKVSTAETKGLLPVVAVVIASLLCSAMKILSYIWVILNKLRYPLLNSNIELHSRTKKISPQLLMKLSWNY